MTGTLKMLRLDILCMKVYSKSYIIFLIYPLLFSFMGVIGMGLMGGMMFGILGGSIFSLQEKNRLERLYGMLALSQRGQVGGRYLFLLGNCLFVIVVMLPIQTIASVMLQKATPAPGDFLLASCIVWILFWIVAGFQAPLYFRYGYTKMRMFGYIPVFIVAVIPTVLISFFKDSAEPSLTAIFEWAGRNIPAVALACLATGTIIAAASYFASLRGCRKTKS